MMIGFEESEMTPGLAKFLRQHQFGGVILFTRNFKSLDQLQKLIHDVVNELDDEKLLIGVDQEGGLVQRFKDPFTVLPKMSDLAFIYKETNDLEYVTNVISVMGSELRDIGVNVNFTPVLDIDPTGESDVLSSRTLGLDVDQVSKLGCHIIDVLQNKFGIHACAKHFPGHGGSVADSHKTLPKVEKTIEELQDFDLVPFKHAVEANVSFVMTGHLLFPKIDPDQPATMSPYFLNDILRQQFGYQNIIVSDDLEMEAINTFYKLDSAAIGSLNASVDMLLICKERDRQEAVYKYVESGLKSKLIDRVEYEASLERIEKIKSGLRYSDQPTDRIGTLQHAEIMDTVSKQLDALS